MSELKLKKQEYQNLINDYRELKGKINDIVTRKKVLREEIKKIKSAVKIEKAKKILGVN